MTSARGALSAAVIQQTAHDIARAEGLEAVTMRRVADSLDVSPMALYHHVGDKDGLLQLVLDAVLAEVEIPSDELPWDDWLRQFARTARAVLRRHPGVAGHLVDRGNWSPPALEVADRALAVLRRDGADADQAAMVYLTFFTFVFARARREEQLAHGSADPAVTTRVLEGLGAPLPALREAASYWIQRAPAEHTEEGIELLLDGFRVRYRLG